MPSLKLGSVELLTRVAREVQPAALGRRLLEFFKKYISYLFVFFSEWESSGSVLEAGAQK